MYDIQRTLGDFFYSVRNYLDDLAKDPAYKTDVDALNKAQQLLICIEANPKKYTTPEMVHYKVSSVMSVLMKSDGERIVEMKPFHSFLGVMQALGQYYQQPDAHFEPLAKALKKWKMVTANSFLKKALYKLKSDEAFLTKAKEQRLYLQ